MIEILKFPISLLPVLAFLAALVFMDSFKLVSLRSVVVAIVLGSFVAIASYFVNTGVADLLDLNVESLRRYVAPVVEEILKAAYIVYLIQARRVGFIVDAAIYGFAVGAGFAVFENVYYAREFENAQPDLWVVRGFGTAIMHGSMTAVFAILTKSISDRYPNSGPLAYLPGLAIAMVVHSTFNHSPIDSRKMAAVFIGAMPLLTIFVFGQSEKATRRWLGTGFDTDVELLEEITSGKIAETRIGLYLRSLKSRFPGEIVADMLCMLQIHLELSARAKGILMAREAGINVTPDETVKANLQELAYLEKSIGKTGKLAMLPFLNMTSRDLWQLYMLGK